MNHLLVFKYVCETRNMCHFVSSFLIQETRYVTCLGWVDCWDFLNMTYGPLPYIFYIHSSHQAVRSWSDSRLYGDTLQRHVELTEISSNNLLNFACFPWVFCPVVFLWSPYWPGSHKRTAKGMSCLEHSSYVVSVHSTFKLFRNTPRHGYQMEWFNFILQRNISLRSINNWTNKSNGIGTKL